MAASQFRIFSSTDVGAPRLSGQTGSLTNLFDAVLVNGYGGTSSLGWSKPLANDSLTSSLGCWRPPSGSRMILYLNDASPTGSTNSPGNEAWACGYESILGLTGSFFPTTGTGAGQFPTASQLFVAAPVAAGGHPSASCWWRKSATADSASRYWVLFGDASTFYMFVQANDTYGVYYVMWFGDIFSLSPNDAYKCMIHGRIANVTNSSTTRFDASDLLQAPQTLLFPNFYMARSHTGVPGAIQVTKVGDRGKAVPVSQTTPAGSSETVNAFEGCLTSVQTDNSLHLSPVWVCDATTGAIRGRMRGIWHLPYFAANFLDGQVFTGGNEHVGRTFQIVKPGPFTSGALLSMWVIETSNTVETN